VPDVTVVAKHIVVDGSNIATEGRTVPSLDQLESAVAEIRKDYPSAEVTVVVDATFAHRIDPSERARFEQATLRGEYVSPPAGAIGRGDAFLLRIAEKVGATVLSNDSFQEFHGEHEWLFEPGRLLGATPVPGVGWIFIPRSPVRGIKSRVAVREASKAKTRVEKAVADATAEATGEGRIAIGTSRPAPTRRRVESATEPPAAAAVAVARRPEAVNAPIPFITFIAAHPLGARVEGVVEGFTSHGAVVMVGDVRCYVPLSGLAQPAPRSAREVLTRGEQRTFVVTALDPARRGVELAVPEVSIVRGVPSEETVAAEVAMTRPRARRTSAEGAPAKRVAAAKRSFATELPPPAPEEAPEVPAPAVKKAAAAKKRAPAKRSAAPVVAAPVAAAPVEEAPAKKRAAPKKAAPRKAAAAKAAGATPAPAAKKAAAAKRATSTRAASAPKEEGDGPRRSPRSRS
jgi:Zc3h12a-like Ribonuclease NYN domain/S1 RNA binding domain